MAKTPLKAIKEFCIECMGGVKQEVKNCTAPNCPLYTFKLGKNPNLSRVLSVEEKEVLINRLNGGN